MKEHARRRHAPIKIYDEPRCFDDFSAARMTPPVAAWPHIRQPVIEETMKRAPRRAFDGLASDGYLPPNGFPSYRAYRLQKYLLSL